MCFAILVRTPTEFSIFLALLLLPHAVSKIQFTLPYQGQTITGLVGSSVNFTWRFSGDVGGIEWGIKKAGAYVIEKKGRILFLDIFGKQIFVHQGYTGRVNGSRTGDSSSGQVIFTLSAITTNDAKSYLCELKANYFLDSNEFDNVKLVVEAPSRITHPTAANESYNEGSPVNISCRAIGTPDPDVKWIHNGKVKSSGVKKADLTFRRVRKADAGMYTCRVNNSAGSDEELMQLIVKYQATIHNISSSVSKSWIGQTVTLTCMSDGVPTPTLSWYKPDGTKFNQVKAKENTAVVTMNSDKDFGLYECSADNSFGLSSKTIHVKQIEAPGLPIIKVDIQATLLTVRWTAPADDGGSPITAYRVVIMQGDTEIARKNVTDPATINWSVGGLSKNTNYVLKVYARNYVFEGNSSQKAIRTNLEGIPEAALIIDLPAETKDVQVNVKWDEPQSNGAPITQCTVYRRTVDDGSIPQEWTKIHIITDITVREIAVKLEKGHDYEIVVTASNKFGESLKDERKMVKISVLGDIPIAVKITDEIILKWKEPNKNGAAITQYSIYQRLINNDQWTKIGTITDVYKREYVVKIEKGKEYEFVITATNKYGESSKEQKIKRIKVLEVSKKPPENQADSVFNKEGLLHGVYVSVILMLSIFTFILIVVLWRMRRRLEIVHSSRKRLKGEERIAMKPIAAEVEEPATQPSSATQQDDAVTYETPGGGDYMPLNPSGRSWEISREEVSVIKVIGKGAFSEVAKATMWCSRDNEYITVAAKMLKANAPASDRKDLLSELELMTKLKPHNHVIKLIGCVTESDPLLVLIEYVPFGDLLGYLRKSRGLNDTYFKDPDVKPQTSLTAEQLMKFAWQVADGMCYLSSKKIIHRDLAARNVLVGEGESGRLPVKWTAYEALLYGIYTTQSDVWSYGILLYEILTVGGSPYPDIIPRQITERLQEGYRMPKPKHVDKKLYQLMLNCWEEQPTDRPTFDKLRKTMKEMERKHKTYVNLSQYDNSQYANVNDLTEG